MTPASSHHLIDSWTSPTHDMTNPQGRSRDRSDTLFKRIQRILGPQIATSRNAAFTAVCLQTLVIVTLLAIIHRKDVTISRLASADQAIVSKMTDFRHLTEDVYGLPPRENNEPLQEAIDEANYDDTAPEITGLTEQKKYTTFWGRFLRCKAVPCNIEHWPYLGDKCFYRSKVHKDKKGHNSSVWSLVQDGNIYSQLYDYPCPAEICRKTWATELNSTRQVTYRTLLEHYQNDTPWNMEGMYLGNAYTRVNQFFGLEYMFHGGFTLTKTNEQGEQVTANKSGSIIVRRGFTHNFCDVSFNGDVAGPEEPIYIIVPYTGRLDQLRIFYGNIHSLINQGVSLRVVISTHGGAVHTLGATELLREMNIGLVEGELRDGSIVQVIDARGDEEGNFSRAVALWDGVDYVPADGLVFFCDVDMTIEPKFFDNCRYNAHRGHQVYYPVVYSLYPYGTKVSREHGYWRAGAYGMLCAYKSDVRRNLSWKFAAPKFKGWGLEDVVIRRGFNNHWQISVFHAVEPNLLHRWHPKYCEFNMNVAACLGTIYQNMGSQRFLAYIVASKGIDVRAIPYYPPPIAFDGFKNSSNPNTSGELNEGHKAHDSYPDSTRYRDMKADYERSIMNGESGLISLFAKEAQEALRAKFDASHAAQHFGSHTQVQPESHTQDQASNPLTQQQQTQEHGQVVHAEEPHQKPPPGVPEGAVQLQGPPPVNLHEVHAAGEQSTTSNDGDTQEIEKPNEPEDAGPPAPPAPEQPNERQF